MRARYALYGAALAGLALGAWLLDAGWDSSEPSLTPVPASAERSAIDAAVELNAQYFYPALERHPRLPLAGSGSAAGGIVSHHDLNSDMIASFFSELSARRTVKTFIILGPNHANRGAPASGGCLRWTTPLGAVDSDCTTLTALTASGLVARDDNVLRDDHAVLTLLPFIRYYFPEAKVVPVLLTSEMTPKRSEQLALGLSAYAPADAFVLASLDFSHYLPIEQAQEKDIATLAAIQSRDYGAIARFDNDYVDSPWALITLMRAMERAGADVPSVLGHGNSGNLSGGDRTETTSYFNILYAH